MPDYFFIGADQIQPESISWLWPDRIALGALSLVEGSPESGKSSLLYDIAARVTSGREMPCSTAVMAAGGVVWISDEDSIATSRRNLEANQADLSRAVIYDKRLQLAVPACLLLLQNAQIAAQQPQRYRRLRDWTHDGALQVGE